jgi:curved DNA-binding protein
MTPVTFRDYYETLGVDRNASEEDIRRAYRQLARRYHPDVSKEEGAEQRFKEISEAYEVLRDPEKRARYDELGPNWKAGEQAPPGGFEGGFGGFEGFGDRSSFRDVRVEFGESGFSDFFDSIFAGRDRRETRGFQGFSTRGADQEASLEITLEEAAAGTRRKISIDGRQLDVDVPPGVVDGQRIRLAGQGVAGTQGGPSGDLFLRVRLLPHPRFRVDGRDLYTDLPVSPWEGALGATVPVPTLRGTANVRVPAGSSSGRRLRLRGQGIPGPGGAKGDLYATVMIHVPRRLRNEERELFERLQEVSDFDPRSGR